MHLPVLPETAVELWASLDKNHKIKSGIYIDATFGEGGHSGRLLKYFPKEKNVVVLGIDWDEEQVKKSKDKSILSATTEGRGLIQEKKLILAQGNYQYLDKIVSSLPKEYKALSVRGILFDLGMCSNQLKSGRGFSFQELDDPLDMRFDPKRNFLTAAQILNEWPEEEIANILKSQGEEKFSRRIAEAIKNQRERGKKFLIVNDLLEVLENTVGRFYKKYRIHFATRAFQAIRMVVNQEEENILEGLRTALNIMAPGGRIVVISFHSGEDRIVKNYFRQESRDCLCPPELPVCLCQHRKSLKILTKKPLRPTKKECLKNPHSRSAKLRAAEKIR